MVMINYYKIFLLNFLFIKWRSYAIDNSKICRALAYEPQETFTSGLTKTFGWYLNSAAFWRGGIELFGSN